MKLTSMTDFVLAEKNSTPVVRNFTGFTEKSNYEKHSYSRIVKYAEFLSQPLKLEMFVPCVDGVPIEYYDMKKSGGKYCSVGSEVEKQAKERVLFEGFELVDGYAIHVDEDDIIYLNEDLCLFFKSIERFEKLMVSKIKLTENALKQIGLKN